MKAEALRCRNVAGMLFNFIGNTVIHSCVKVELSYEIKKNPAQQYSPPADLHRDVICHEAIALLFEILYNKDKVRV